MPAFYLKSISGLLADTNEQIIGELTHNVSRAGFDHQKREQTLSWFNQLNLLRNAFTTLVTKFPDAGQWTVLLEYPIARRGKRIDVVIIAHSVVIVLEFKVGAFMFNSQDAEQLMDYCLDLRDFHYESRKRKLYPVLVSTESGTVRDSDARYKDSQIQPLIFGSKFNLAEILIGLYQDTKDGTPIDAVQWNKSRYEPTPTIIEAAQVLFSGKSVEEISRSHAGTKNLTRTTDAVIRAIMLAKERKEKIICFITGVPGAGKTLAGLNIAHHAEFQNEENSLATFLSGNGPLIKVLRAALSRDAAKRSDGKTNQKKQDRILAFIENVHRFIDEYFFDGGKTPGNKIPNNRIVIFDEAQRAWNALHSKRKFDRDFSEPEMMFEIMNRHKDWAAIVALVGGGQEINTGEAGLREWGDNIIAKFADWKVYISPQLKTGDHSTGNLTLFEKVPANICVVEDEDLHLDVSIRSYKAEKLSNWVQLLLNGLHKDACDLFNRDLNDFQIVMTRDLAKAKQWLNNRSVGTRRVGLVASSGGRRLRAHGLDVKAELEEAHWFLNPKGDVRSSYAMEVPATEFGIQGLELDWTGVCWDADLRRTESGWDFKSFKGSEWKRNKKADQQQYTLNKYRVLLTRAREGMVIWIPEGDDSDVTRLPEFYNPIYDYLKSCGVPDLA